MDKPICYIRRSSLSLWDTVNSGIGDELWFVSKQTEDTTSIQTTGWWTGTSEEDILWYPIDRNEREKKVARKIDDTNNEVTRLEKQLKDKKLELNRILNFQEEYQELKKKVNINNKQ